MVDTHDLRCKMDHANAQLIALIDERTSLITAVIDLLAFQREAMDVISSVGWPNGSARRVEGLVDQFRRPTVAIAKARALVSKVEQPEQHELPLAPLGDPRQSLD